MAKPPLPSPERLRQLLIYEPSTGSLTWRHRPEWMFSGGRYPAPRRAASWNSRCAGKPAFTHVGTHGYREGAVDNRLLLAHRVIWAVQTGSWPPDEIDHADGDRQNNRWANLSAVTHARNLRNAAGKSTNQSGITGVSWRPSRGKWRARLMVGGRELHLGHFSTKEEAASARDAALRHHDFSERHGVLSDEV